MKRTLRMGMVGGGLGAQTGETHRLAARMTGCIELACGAFSSDRQRSRESGEALALPRDRVYGSYRELLKKEARRPADERIDFVAIAAPNNLHYPVAMAAFDAGFHVLCDKPMTTNLDEARNLLRKQQAAGLRFCVAFNHVGYPLVREARALIRQGHMGTIRRVVVEHPQGWLATRLENTGNRQAGWRTDPRRAGPVGCMADLGSHCVHLAEYVTGLRVTAVSADLRASVAGRPLDDDGTVMLRFDNGARGVLWASQVCVGEQHGLRLRVYGERGGLMWEQERPGLLHVHALNGHTEIRQATGPSLSRESARTNWHLPGEGGGMLESFAHVYQAFAHDLQQLVHTPTATEPPDYPGTADGLRVMRFLDALIQNIQPENASKWTAVSPPE